MNTPGGVPPWMALLLTGLAGRPVGVQPLAIDQPSARGILVNDRLLVPAAVAQDEDQREGRAAVAHAAAHLLYSLPAQPTQGLKPMSVAVIAALEDARVERLAMRRWPGLRRWWAASYTSALADNDLTFGAFLARLAHTLFDPATHDGNYWVDKGRRLFEAQARTDLHDRAAFRHMGSLLANDLGQMRVRFEPEQYRVFPAYRDDNSYLWTFPERNDVPPPDAQSLEAPPQRTTWAAREEAVGPGGDQGSGPEEIELGRQLLPEWDRRIERYRRDWCTVVDMFVVAPDRAVAATIALPPPAPRAASARLSRTRQLRRQTEGDALDLDAVVEVLVDWRLGLSPEPRLFRRPGREVPPTSLLVLLDLSASANDTCDDRGTTVLGLEQQAALSLTQQRRADASRLAVHGFHSNTRAHVTYQRLLDFGEPFDARAAGRLAAVRARYSTRMGAAIRRATAVLADESGTRRNLLVVTDGMPSDIDSFDPRYLIEDARMAVIEAGRHGVRVQCVTLDAHGESPVRRIFGWRNYRIATDPRALASHLQQLQARAAAA
ncbi:MAG: VWA domain-containing protein [Burkholderiaceae bacterium]